jgi:hypothetical protein
MLVADHDVGVAAVMLNFTVLVPCVAPKFVPVIVTVAPTGPVVGDSDVMFAFGSTVNATPLLATPPTVTVTLPVVAAAGTSVTMLDADHDDTAAAVPLNFTELEPCVAPKFVPVIVTAAPAAPLVGESDVMIAAGTTVNVGPVAVAPPTVTVTAPVVAPAGTVVTMLEFDHDVGVAAVPLKLTVLVPCVAPKFVPLIVTDAPTAPLVGAIDVMVGAAATVNTTPLLATPPTVTTTLPDVAPAGTVATMLVADHDDGVAVVALNFTVLVPCVAPKFVPVIVTVTPTAPLVGASDVMLGDDRTVNATPLLAVPLTVTTTLPVVAAAGTVVTMLVADHDVGVAWVPLNFTVLMPCVAPKFVPVIVTVAPTAPDVGATDVIVGDGATVNTMVALLLTPPTVATTAPVVAPAGTGVTMLVADHDVGVAVVPLNFTVLVPCVAPKFVPLIVTVVPTGPLVGDRLRIVGVPVTVNSEPLLAVPPTVTTTLPVVVPLGTSATMLVSDHDVGLACTPLNATVLDPCVAPKLEPAIVTDVEIGPDEGVREVIVGAAAAPTVNWTSFE